MANLNTTLQGLAEKFAADLLEAVRHASLTEILGSVGPAKSAPRAAAKTSGRGSRSAITVDAIVAVLRQHKDGLRSEHLRKALGAKRGAWRYQMQKAIAEKRVRMTGTKNSAVYFAK